MVIYGYTDSNTIDYHKITPEMLSFDLPDTTIIRLQSLSATFTKLHLVLSNLGEAERDYIRRNVFIANIGASTRIENAILTDVEISWIDTTLTEDSKTTSFIEQREFILNKLSKDKERSLDEVAGCRSMLNLIHEQGAEMFPLTEAILRGLHRELLQYHGPSNYHAGGYKQVTNSVVRRMGEQTVPVLQTAAPGLETEQAVVELLSWYNELSKRTPWSVAVATEFVFRFLAAHPFQDGNGRLGRALFSLALIHSPNEAISELLPYLPIDRHIERKREDYYTVLRQCSDGRYLRDPRGYNYLPFLNFMIKVLEGSLNDFAFYRQRFSVLNSLSDSCLAILRAFKELPELRLQAKDFVESSGFARPTINEAIRTLLKFGLIQRYGQGAGTKYQLVF